MNDAALELGKFRPLGAARDLLPLQRQLPDPRLSYQPTPGTPSPAPGDKAWYDDLSVLARRPLEVVPAADLTRDERLNAAVRFLGYAALAGALVLDAGLVLACGGVAVAAVSTAHAAAQSARAAKPPRKRPRGGADARPLESDECTRSTPDNPFANFLPGDDPARPPACENMDDEVRANFFRNLPRSLYDVYDTQTNFRNFHTMPVTTAAPDIHAFAEFCYGPAGARGCKEDASRCHPATG